MGSKFMTSSGWPTAMPILEPQDFVVRAWQEVIDPGNASVDDLFAAGDGGLTPEELDALNCKTSCCMMGHIRHSFGQPANPEYGDPTPKNGIKFALKFLENWRGKEFANKAKARLKKTEGNDWQTPDNVFASAFDGDPSFASRITDPDEWFVAITEEEATKAWEKAIADFGYTETVYE